MGTYQETESWPTLSGIVNQRQCEECFQPHQISFLQLQETVFLQQYQLAVNFTRLSPDSVTVNLSAVANV